MVTSASAGNTTCTAVPSTGSGLGPGIGESILPSVDRWAKNTTTLMGNGKGGLQTSFMERYEMKITGLADAMSTTQYVEDFLH
jgi:hypothetical protein